MAETGNNKRRLLRLLQYLYEFTDEKNKVTTQDLIRMLSDEGMSCNRMTVKHDVDMLIDAGFDIIVDRGADNSNEFCYGTKVFELPELKLLIDAVSSSRFITTSKSEALIKKLAHFAGPSEEKKLTARIYTGDRVKSSNKQLFLNIESIREAIDTGRKVQFQYYDYSPEKQRILRHGGEVYVNSPYALFWNDDRYYMIGYSEKHQKVVSFRIDRMIKVKIIEEGQIPASKDFSVAAYAKKVIKMYDGVEREVILSCENKLMMSVIDRFGIDIETERMDDDHFKARIMVQTSPTFYGWIFQFGGMIRIMGPEEVKQEYCSMLQNQLENE